MLGVEIIGNLGSDPEQRFTSAGVAQTTFRAAVNSRKRATREGEKRTSYDIWADDVVNLSQREDGAAAPRPVGDVSSAPLRAAGGGAAGRGELRTSKSYRSDRGGSQH